MAAEWKVCSVRRAAIASGASLAQLLWAEVGIYIVWLSKPDECWTWRVEYAGRVGMPNPHIEDASGLFAGSEADAKARAEAMAELFSRHVDEAPAPRGKAE